MTDYDALLKWLEPPKPALTIPVQYGREAAAAIRELIQEVDDLMERTDANAIGMRHHCRVVYGIRAELDEARTCAAEAEAVIERLRYEARDDYEFAKDRYLGYKLRRILDSAPGAVLAEVKAQALEDAADVMNEAEPMLPSAWLRRRADSYRKETGE